MIHVLTRADRTFSDSEVDTLNQRFGRGEWEQTEVSDDKTDQEDVFRQIGNNTVFVLDEVEPICTNLRNRPFSKTENLSFDL